MSVTYLHPRVVKTYPWRISNYDYPGFAADVEDSLEDANSASCFTVKLFTARDHNINTFEHHLAINIKVARCTYPPRLPSHGCKQFR